MSRLCPEGHESAASDYCDTCGAPMGAPAPASAPPPAPASSVGAGPDEGAAADVSSAATQECPHCGTTNPATHLFCEVCGYDFTTGVMPRPVGGEPSFLDLSGIPTPAPAEPDPVLTDAPAPAVPPPPAPSTAGRPDEAAPGRALAEDEDGVQVVAGPSASSLPPEMDAADVAAEPDPGATGGGAGETAGPPAPPVGAEEDSSAPARADDEDVQVVAAPPASGLPPEPEPGPKRRPKRGPDAAPAPAAPSAAATPFPAAAEPTGASRPVNRPPSREVAADWVVEVWIDPDWYAVQESGEAAPSPAPPEIVRLPGRAALVGRRSASRNIHPDVDCGLDTGVSRRQARLTSDGRRWWIEDLDSANGTYVGPAIGPLPDAPIDARTEVDADDRIYVGAWTRLVLRPATDTERTDAT